MNTTTPNEAEILQRYSRRSLWIGMLLVLLIGAAASPSLAFPNTEVFRYLATWLPIFTVCALFGLKRSAKGLRATPSAHAMKELMNDELRQQSLKLAYRNGFFAVLLVQPLLALAPMSIEVAYPAPFTACLTIITGVVVAIASLLYFDR